MTVPEGLPHMANPDRRRALSLASADVGYS